MTTNDFHPSYGAALIDASHGQDGFSYRVTDGADVGSQLGGSFQQSLLVAPLIIIGTMYGY
jgi:hypothetical protein